MDKRQIGIPHVVVKNLGDGVYGVFPSRSAAERYKKKHFPKGGAQVVPLTEAVDPGRS